MDQEDDFRITWLAPDFETFIGQLVHEDVYAEDPEEEKAQALALVQGAPFSSELRALLDAYPDPALPAQLRALAVAIVQDKGYFALHADHRSKLMYDILFLLHTHPHPVQDGDSYLKSTYPMFIAMARAEEFSTGGYSPDFLTNWLKAARKSGRIVHSAQGWQFTPQARDAVLQAIANADDTKHSSNPDDRM